MEQREERYIMGTQIEIIIEGAENAQEDIQEAFEIFSWFESEFSRFLLDSDLSQLNSKKSYILSDRFIEIIKLIKDIHKVTQGYFNPLLDPRTIWYAQSFEKWIFQKQERQINLDLDTIEIQGNRVILQEYQNLDLWGIVKGYCVDRVYKFLSQKWYKSFIINAGGDIRISWKYTIAIDSPFMLWDIFALLDIENKAISTSGTYKRNWKIKREKYHHILSPEERNTHNDEIVSVSLISDNCYISDAYATACIAMWLEKSLFFLKNEKIDGLIIMKNKEYCLVGNIDSYSLEII